MEVEGDAEIDTGEKGESSPRPDFPALSAREMGGGKDDYRRIRCPPHRLTPLKNAWEDIVTPTVEHMKLQIRWVFLNICLCVAGYFCGGGVIV